MEYRQLSHVIERKNLVELLTSGRLHNLCEIDVFLIYKNAVYDHPCQDVKKQHQIARDLTEKYIIEKGYVEKGHNIIKR